MPEQVEAILTSVGPALQKRVDALTDSKVTSSLGETLKRVEDRVNALAILRLSESAREHLAAQLHSVLGARDELLKQIAGLSVLINDRATAQKAELRDALQRAEAALQKVEGAVATVRSEQQSAAAAARKEADDNQKQVLQTLNETQKSLHDVRTAAVELRREAGERAHTATVEQAALKQDLKEAKEELTQLSSAVTDRLEVAVSHLATQQKESDEQAASALQKLQQQLGDTRSKLDTAIEPSLKANTDALSQLQQTLVDTHRGIRTAQKETQRAVREELGPRVVKVGESMDALREQAATKLDRVGERQAAIEGSLDRLAGAVPGDLSAQLGALGGELAALQRALKLHQDSLSTVHHKTEQIATAVDRDLGPELGQVHHEVGSLKEGLSQARSDLGLVKRELGEAVESAERRLTEKLDSFRENLGAFSSAHAEGLDELKEPTLAVQRSVGDGLGNSLGHVHHDLRSFRSEANGKLDTMAGQLARVKGTVQGEVLAGLGVAKQAIDGLGMRLEQSLQRVERDVSSCERSVRDELRSGLDEVKDSLGALENGLAQSQTAVCQQLAQLARESGTALSGIRDSVGTALSQRIENQGAELGSLRREISELQNELTGALTSISDATSVLSDHGSDTRQQLGSLSAGMGQNQTVLVEQIHTLQKAATDQQSKIEGVLSKVGSAVQDGIRNTLPGMLSQHDGGAAKVAAEKISGQIDLLSAKFEGLLKLLRSDMEARHNNQQEHDKRVYDLLEKLEQKADRNDRHIENAVKNTDRVILLEALVKEFGPRFEKITGLLDPIKAISDETSEKARGAIERKEGPLSSIQGELSTVKDVTQKIETKIGSFTVSARTARQVVGIFTANVLAITLMVVLILGLGKKEIIALPFGLATVDEAKLKAFESDLKQVKQDCATTATESAKITTSMNKAAGGICEVNQKIGALDEIVRRWRARQPSCCCAPRVDPPVAKAAPNPPTLPADSSCSCNCAANPPANAADKKQATGAAAERK